MEALFKKKQTKPANTHDEQGAIKLTAIKQSLDEINRSLENPVSVENFDEVKLHLKSELAILAGNIKTILSAIKVPDSFKIEGIPKYPDQVTVKDFIIKVELLKDLIEVIHDLRLMLAQVDFKPEIQVSHEVKIPEIKVPKVDVKVPPVKVPEPKVTVNNDIDLSELLEALKPLKHLSNQAKKALSVRLSDGKDFIKAFDKLVGKQERLVTAFSTSKGMDESEFVNKFTQLTQASGIVSGSKAIASAGTAEKLVATSTKCFRVDVCASTGNTNAVAVGGADVKAAAATQKGTVLLPGEVVTIYIDDVSKIYGDVITNGEKICFTYYTR